MPPQDDVLVCRYEEVTAGQIRGQVKLACLGPNQTKSFAAAAWDRAKAGCAEKYFLPQPMISK